MSAKSTALHPRPTPKGAERYKELIDAAILRIADVGIEGLRVRDISSDVGVNIATLHYYFPRKEDLIVAVVVTLTRQLSEIHLAENPPHSRPRGSRTSLDQLKKHVGVIYQHMRNAPWTFVVMMELMLRANRDHQVSTALTAAHRPWQTFLISLMTSKVAPSEGLSRARAEKIADQFVSIILGECLQLASRGALGARVDRGALKASKQLVCTLLDSLLAQ